jgi:hypothetical protein
MTSRSTAEQCLPVTDVVALAALAWVAAATLHEGLGHGLACTAMGGDPTRWSTFHFSCDRLLMSLWDQRIVAGAGTAVNAALAAVGWYGWTKDGATRRRLAGWIVFTLNGLTAFGYLVFSAIFQIGDWNGYGVMAEVANPIVVRGTLAIIGVAGYYGIVRAAACMLSQTLGGKNLAGQARRLAAIVWITTGVISFGAALSAGSDWRSTIGALIGVALGGNAGLFSLARFVKPTTIELERLRPNWALVGAAIVATVTFVALLGPGIAL